MKVLRSKQWPFALAFILSFGIIIALIAIFFDNNNTEQAIAKKNHRQEDGLYGNVKSCEKKEYLDRLQENLFSVSFFEYNKQGNYKRINYVTSPELGPRGFYSTKERFIYKNNVLQKSVRRVSQTGGRYRKKTTNYHYDDQGNLTKEVTISNADNYQEGSVLYVYNDLNKLIKYIDISPNGTARIRFYDNDGYLREWSFYDENKEATSINLYFYNENGYKTLMQTYDNDRNIVSEEHYSDYDSYGNYGFCVKYSFSRNTSSQIKYTYKYDSSGNWVEKTEETLEKEGEKITKASFTLTVRNIKYY